MNSRPRCKNCMHFKLRGTQESCVCVYWQVHSRSRQQLLLWFILPFLCFWNLAAFTFWNQPTNPSASSKMEHLCFNVTSMLAAFNSIEAILFRVLYWLENKAFFDLRFEYCEKKIKRWKHWCNIETKMFQKDHLELFIQFWTFRIDFIIRDG